MTETEIDAEVRKFYQELTGKIKGYVPGNLNPENGEVVDECIDYYFQLKNEQIKQLELEF